MVCHGIWPYSWRSEECGWKWFQSGECDICKYLWSRVSSFLIFSAIDTDPSFFSFFLQSYGSFQSARSCRGMSPFFLHSSFKPCFYLSRLLFFFVYFPCLLLWQEHALFSKLSVHLFMPPCLCVFWQDLITRWIMDIPLLLEPTQAASVMMDWFQYFTFMVRTILGNFYWVYVNWRAIYNWYM